MTRFREVQRPPSWFWLVMSAAVAVVAIGTTLGESSWISLIVVVLSALFMVSLTLTTEVRSDEIVLWFQPLRRRRISLKDIEDFEVASYRPIRDYGGWGIRYSFRLGWAYIMSGSRGVRMEINNKRPLLIGSQRPEELALAIEQARSR